MIFDPARVVIIVWMQILKVMYFGVFADLDEAGIRCQEIGVAEIPEIRLVLQTGIEKKLPLAIVLFQSL